uniref:Uncharacterized protein n=1 Tax=Romanomermis culicivorax TaxID=13658 RepID=A0A915JL19_ROMCU
MSLMGVEPFDNFHSIHFKTSLWNCSSKFNKLVRQAAGVVMCVATTTSLSLVSCRPLIGRSHGYHVSLRVSNYKSPNVHYMQKIEKTTTTRKTAKKPIVKCNLVAVDFKSKCFEIITNKFSTEKYCCTIF